MRAKKLTVLLLVAILAALPMGCGRQRRHVSQGMDVAGPASVSYKSSPVTEVNGGVPNFTDNEISHAKSSPSLIEFKELDSLGRTRQAYAVLDQGMMPGEDIKRGIISDIRPTGWKQAKYEWIGNGGWLYNRCHLIAWSLVGKDDARNLMTGTWYFNTEAMLPYEMRILQYLEENTANHVMYRVTPVYEGDDLLARGVLLEAYSIEDDGGLSFCMYAYNVQPGVAIDYATGRNHADR